MSSSFKKLINRRVGALTVLGFSSGLPLALSGSSLQAWMTIEGVDLKTIGIFSLVGLPYTLKFLWSPLMDRFVPPIFGRRRGWILVCQFLLLVFIFLMGVTSPRETPWLMAFLAVFVAFFSASQDVVIDAYRTDVTRQEERGLAVAVSVTGYRTAMLVSGAMAMVFSQYIGWGNTYILMATLVIIGICGTFWGPEPERLAETPKSLAEAVYGPFKNFITKPTAFALLALIILYKLGDAFAGSLTTVFLIRAKAFSLAEVGIINKGMGLSATLIGALLGGVLMAKLGLFRSLLYYGILQAISNLSFMVIAALEKNYFLMALAVGIENLSGGMGTAAFVAFLMALCDPRYTATQFALLSAFASLGRVLVGPPSGVIAEQVGWVSFFGVTFFAAIPGLILLWLMRESIKNLGQRSDN